MPKNYKWIHSYEDYAFDTVDGNLHDGEYNIPNDFLGGFLIHNPQDVLSYSRVKVLDTTGLTEIQRIANRAFDVMEDPDTGLRERYPSTLQTYRSLAVKNAGPRVKIKE